MTTTDFKHPKCYANVDGGCSTKISGEHYISHGLIRLYTFNDDTVRLMHDHGYGIPHPVSPRQFVANVLCEAHNNGMSDLDTAAINLATFLQSIALRFLGGAGEWGPDETIRISGDDFERWALKLLLTHAAVNAFTRDGGGSRITTTIPDDAVREMLGTNPWPENTGLCVASTPKHRLKFDPFTPVEAITNWWGVTPFHTGDGILCGGIAELAGIGFGLSLDTEMRRFPAWIQSENPLRQTILRPAYMAWQLDGVEKRVEFEWADNSPHKSITYTLIRGD